ncbi:recombinase family protein [Cetobacterium sp.]|uniref:recombinase family protein n=1 Tax=Cetobacterium sp. TaxID=2071632 RepID=UPI003EE7407C
MNKIYGYCRVSTKEQVITRQIENILKEYPNAKIYQEAFTGTVTDRKEWNKVKKIVKVGDTIVFDSVSRMSRNADEGVKEYMELLDKGVNLIFLKEKYINTEVYQEQLKINTNLKTDDTDLNETIMKGVGEYLKRLATRQIIIAFEQSEKEVQDLRQRTREGMAIAKAKGSQIGREKGVTFETKKSKEMKEKIQKLSKDFNGTLKDTELMELLKIARNSYYKYKKELLNNKLENQ